jgi:subtilisin family serine protease
MAWNYDFIQRDDALQLAKQALGDPLPWGEPDQPGSIRVAHLDTGYTFHPVFGFDSGNPLQPTSRIITRDGGDFFAPARKTAFDPLKPFEVWDFTLQPGGHGTSSGSMLAGDAGADFGGVVPGLPLLPMRVTDGSVLLGRRADAVAAAIRAVTQPAGKAPLAPIINISLGRTTGHVRLGEAIDAAYEKGIIVVCAAGQIAHSVTFPAAYERAIAVAGIKTIGELKYDVYWPYSDGGLGYRKVDVWAPAAGLRRANVSSAVEDAPPPNSYQYDYEDEGVSGTTYAAAHVSAAAALWTLMHRQALDALPEPWMRVEAFRRALLTHRQVSVFRTKKTRDLKAAGNKAFPLKMDFLLKTPPGPVQGLEKAGT